MHILLNGLTQRPGGGLVVLEGLVSGLAGASDDLTLTVLAYDEVVYSTLVGLNYRNVNVIQAPKLNGLIDKLIVPFRVRTASRNQQCDLVLTLNFFIPLIPVPQIVYHVDMERFEHHSVFPVTLHNILEKIRDRSARRALNSANANVFESVFLQKTAETHCALKPRRPSVIYIGIKQDTLLNLSDKHSQLSDGLIVAVTNPLGYKNSLAMVPVLAGLIQQEPEVDWKLRIFGGQGESAWSELIQAASHAGVSDKIEFMGYQSREVLNESLDVAICLLNTSLLESFCMVALEAMARRCPVIVSASAAMPESVGDAGIVIEPDNTDKIVEEILRLRFDSEFRAMIEAKSVQRAAELTWEKSGKAFYELGRSLTNSSV